MLSFMVYFRLGPTPFDAPPVVLGHAAIGDVADDCDGCDAACDDSDGQLREISKRLKKISAPTSSVHVLAVRVVVDWRRLSISVCGDLRWRRRMRMWMMTLMMMNWVMVECAD